MTTKDNTASILGYIGGSILAVQLIPQIIKVCRKKSAQDISFITLFLNITGGSLVIAYGILISQPPVYATVICSMSCNIILLLCKSVLDGIHICPVKKINVDFDELNA